VNNKIVLVGPGINVTIGAVGASGDVLALSSDGSLILSGDRQVNIDLKDGLTDSPIEFWMFSTPQSLGTRTFDGAGKASVTLTVPEDVPSGNHRLVIKMKAVGNVDKVLSIGLVVGSVGSGVSISRIILGILLAAVVIGLAIPATRRRRRRATI
jgi:hypothetical protein